MSNKSQEKRPVGEDWLSLEQTAEVLGMPQETVRRWARDGDPRLPAYKVWDEQANGYGRFRFKKSDVEAFQTRALAQDAGQSPT